VGSGKSLTPLSRMHWANLRAACCLLGTPLASREPRWLQVLTRADACLKRRAVRVHRRAVRYPIDGEIARTRPGPGTPWTPFFRMHSANFTA